MFQIKQIDLSKQIKQIRFSQQDKASFLVPKLEKEIELEVKELKRKKDWIIKLGCIISIFSLRSGFELTANCYSPSSNEFEALFLIPSFLFMLFFCSISGYFIDILCIEQTWSFLISTNMMFQMILFILTLIDSPAIFMIGSISYYSLAPIYIINFTCILYEAARDFRDRLNNVVKLEVYGEFSAFILSQLLKYIINESQDISNDQKKSIHKIILIVALIFCQILNVTSLLILRITYQQIEKIKFQSFKYQRFLIYQGSGLSLDKIYKYMRNKNIYYLLALSFLCGFSIDSEYKILGYSTSSLYTVIRYLVTVFFGLIIMKLVNSRQELVSSCYKTISYCLYFYFFVAVFYLILPIEQEQKMETDSIYFIVTLAIFIVDSIAWLVLYCQIHQILIILLPKRCSMKAIGLSITFFVYFCGLFFSDLISGGVLVLRLVKAILVIIIIAINFFFQKNIKFEYIENRLQIQYKFK